MQTKNLKVAHQRGKAATKSAIKQHKEIKSQQENKKHHKKSVRDLENKRAKLISSLPPPGKVTEAPSLETR